MFLIKWIIEWLNTPKYEMTQAVELRGKIATYIVVGIVFLGTIAVRRLLIEIRRKKK